jgi:hypothetical protein
MPGQFLTESEWARLTRFPTELTTEDLSTYFTLTTADKALVHQQRGAHNRLGFALQMGALRLMGFCPDDLTTAPPALVRFLAQQLEVVPEALADYGARAQTRTDHFHLIQRHLGFRAADMFDLAALAEWLVARALEHDKPILLFQLAAEKLYHEKIVRPGVTMLERMVITARVQAQEATYQQLVPLLT